MLKIKNLSKCLVSAVILGAVIVNNVQVFAGNISPSDGDKIGYLKEAATSTPDASSNKDDTLPDNLLITEINMNDVSRDSEYGSESNDIMEYVEITNPTDTDIRLNDQYKLKYCYPSGSTVKEKELNISSFDDSEVVVPAKKSVILWDYREGLTSYKKFPTLQEFKAAYNISDDVKVYKLTGQNGLANEDRGLNLYKNNESVSSYWWTADDEDDGKCVQLQPLKGKADMYGYKKKANLTPGQYDDQQIHFVKNSNTSPDVNLLDTDIDSIDEGKQLFINYSVKDDVKVEKVTVYYKTSNDSDYKSIVTNSFATPNKYYMMIPSDKLLHSKYVDYYIVAENAYRSTTSPVRRIKVNSIDMESGTRSSIKDNQIVSGNYDFISKSFDDDKNFKMYIDDTELSAKQTLEKESLFTFSYSGVDSYFQDGVTIGNDVVKTFSKCNTILGTSSMTIPIDRKYITYNEDGSASLKLTLRAGTWGSIWEGNTDANNDDYAASKFYLHLTDGTVIKPDNLDPEKAVNIGDSAGMSTALDISYTIPKDKLSAFISQVDTTKLQDGEHAFKITNAEGKGESVKFIVDNTSPSINVNIQDGQVINSNFTPKIDISDNNGGKVSSVTLDGINLTSDYSFNGTNLTTGNHTLIINAEDLAGNKSSKSITFKSNAKKSKIESIAYLSTGSDKASIGVKVNGTDSVVSLYKSSKLSDIKYFDGDGDVITGEVACDKDSIASSKKGENPYRICEINVSGKDNDIVSVNADATTNYNLNANFYVYNTKNNAWDKLECTRDGSKIKSQFEVLNHVNDGKAKVIIEATNIMPHTSGKNQSTQANNYVWDGKGIPNQYDFSMAWITDTQYYSESWPGNYDLEANWIVDNADKLNIKYTIHTGDIVDDFNEDYEWKNADKSMSILDKAGMPYGVLGGNHDVAHGNKYYDSYWKYFGQDRFKKSGVYGESYKNNLGHYDLIDADGQSLLMLYMSWDIYTNELEWINQILAKYPDRKAIICVHGGIDAKANESYTSNLLLNNVCAKNSNVIAIINGHYHGASINTVGFDDNKDGKDDRCVYQICTDYQSADQGGLCYIKMIYFDLANNKIYMNSYSPLVNDYNYFDKDRLDSYGIGTVDSDLDIYDLNVDFGRKEKTLSVKDFNANLLSEQLIGTANSSNGQVNLDMNNLKDGENYSIFAKSTNEYGLTDISDPYTFKFESLKQNNESETGNTQGGNKTQGGTAEGGDKPQGGNTSGGIQNTYDNKNIIKYIIGLFTIVLGSQFVKKGKRQ